MPEDDKKKKKKKSKKQIQAELERQAEEARKAEEADLKRQEDEEKRRNEQEEQRKKNREEKRVAEFERLKQQVDEDKCDAWARREEAINNYFKTDANSKEWNRYIECNPLPDPYKESDLNAHLTLWGTAEDFPAHAPPAEPSQQVTAVVQGCGTTERVIDLLTYHVMAEASEMDDRDKLQWAQHYIDTLRDLEQKKLDKLTANVLQCTDAYERNVDADKGEHRLNGESKDKDRKIHPNSERESANTDMKLEILEGASANSVDFGIWAHTDQRFFRRKNVVFRDMNVTVDLPKSVAMLKGPIALRVIRTSYDNVSTRSSDADLVSLGGILLLQQLNMPPAPKSLKGGWTFRELTPLSDTVSVMPYNANSLNNAQPQPYRITFKVPATVYLPVSNQGVPRLGWWNSKTLCWEDDGLTDIKYNADDKTVSVSTINLEPMALIQPRALDFPYRSWRLVPLSSESAILRICTSRLEVDIEIIGSVCRLLRPSLPHLAHRLLPPGTLLRIMAKSGINIMPTDDDAHYCRKPLKSRGVESKVHDAIASVLPSFEIQCSSWNHSRANNQCVFRMRRVDLEACQRRSISNGVLPELPRESTDETGQSGWLTAIGEEKRFAFIQAPTAETEEEEELPGECTHASLRRCVMAFYRNKKAREEEQAAADKAAGVRPVLDFEAYANETKESEPDRLERELGDDEATLQFQLTARRLLNIVRLFTFH